MAAVVVVIFSSLVYFTPTTEAMFLSGKNNLGKSYAILFERLVTQ
jgi:hypothetical protein